MREKPEAKVYHKIKVQLHGTGLKDKPKSKTELLVRQPAFLDTRLEQAIDREITQCCCCSAGTSKTAVAFQSSFLDMTETAHCNFTVDNSDCKINVAELQY